MTPVDFPNTIQIGLIIAKKIKYGGAMKRKRRWNSSNIIMILMGSLMAFSLVAGLLINFIDPNLTGPNASSGDPVDFEITQVPTVEQAQQLPFPFSDVTISRRVTQRTGLFQMPLPEGDWSVLPSSGDTYDPNNNRADLIIRSGERLVIVQTTLQLGINYEDAASLSENYLTDGFLLSDWSTEYDTVEIADRTVSDFFVTVDFNLLEGDLGYYGRQISWQESGHLFNLRLVVPNNNPELLANLQAEFIKGIVFYPHLLDSPLESWEAKVDTVFNYMLKLPVGWQVLSGESGVPITYYDPTQDEILATTQSASAQNVTSLEEAQSFVAELREDAEIIEVQAVTQAFTEGYWISYSYPNFDGDRISAAVALFNNGADVSFVEIRLSESGLNLVDATSENVQVVLARQILETFTVLAP